MSNFWTITKYGFALVALPLAVTAAASAHQRIANATPISLEVTPVVSELANIGVERCHTVALNRIGGVDGRIVALSSQADRGLSDVVVRFVKNGKTIRKGVTNSEGIFSVNNVPEGVYSFIASGESTFAAYQVNVVADTGGSHSKVIELGLVSKNKSLSKVLKSNVVDSDDLVADGSGEIVSDGANRVALVDGSLLGTIFTSRDSLVTDVKVDILQNGSLVASVFADASGQYEVPGLEFGVYELVAIGADCAAAIGFEIVDSENLSADSSFVSTGAVSISSYATSLLVTAVSRQDLAPEEAAEVEFIEEDDDRGIIFSTESVTMGGAFGSAGAAPGTFVGGGGGGVFGGGGGAVGGGGLGRLVAIGGLTVGIIALADDGGASPVSPVLP